MPLCLRSRVALFTNVFLSCVSFAIVMPSLWPYLRSLRGSRAFLAYVVAVYSVGEAAGAVLFGRVSAARSTRATLTCAAALGALGSALYVAADALPRAGPLLVLAARLLQGAWTGASQAVQQAYLADVLPAHHLTPTTVTLNAYACLGFVVGPAFGVLVNLLPEVPLAAGLRFTTLTGPGFFVLLSAFLVVALLLAVFDEDADRAPGRAPADGEYYDEMESGAQEHAPLLKRDARPDAEELKRADHPLRSPLGVALLVCNAAFFTHFYGFALQETITTPLVQEFYQWSVLTANMLFTFAGVCALAAFVFAGLASRHTSDQALLMFSLALGAVGYLLLLCTPAAPLPVSRFLVAFAVISVAFPMGRAVTVSLYTKLLPMPMQGTGQGVILAVGAVARILGPFWAVKAFAYEWGAAIVFGATAAGFAACMALVGACYGYLKT